MDEQVEKVPQGPIVDIEATIRDAIAEGASVLPSPDELEFSTGTMIALVAMSLMTIYFVWKSKGTLLQKLIAFLTCHFLLTGEYDYAYTIPAPGFELQPSRLLFFAFSAILFIDHFFKKKLISEKDDGPKSYAWFEIWLFLLVFYNAISQFFHLDELQLKDVIVNSMYQFYVLIIYITIKKYASKELMRLIGISMITGAVIATFIAIYQFIVDPLALRIGDFRIAFGTMLRANGSFTNEYFFAYYVIIALCWSMIYVKNMLLRNMLMGLFIIGVFISFQRMSWVVLSLIMALYIFRIAKIRYEVLAFLGTGGMILLIVIGLVFSRQIMNSSLVTHRLSEKPSGRLGYWGMVMNNIGKSPFVGFGSTQSKTYFKEMLKVTQSRVRATAAEGDLHSGYLSTMFYYGVPAFMFFVLFNFSSIIYFGKLLPKHQFF
ncbi:MAG: O-antigen ligase family protein, partial [Bacteroidota bacterium]